MADFGLAIDLKNTKPLSKELYLDEQNKRNRTKGSRFPTILKINYL